MRKGLILSLVMGVILMSTQFIFAGQDEFQTTSQEMIEVLTKEPKRYRSFKKRAIVVIESGQEKSEKTIIYVDESVEAPKVKIKVHFDYDSARLGSNSHALLSEVGQALNSKELQLKKIIVNGHTDSDGTTDYNLHLSYRRANAVKKYLVDVCHVSEYRLMVRGFGESMPLKPNNNAGNKQINRRVEFEILR
ncbi:MAG: OmpA family protein [Desulfotignum sp.]|nr:OmpA family protein [Desulfotignum sp.]